MQVDVVIVGAGTAGAAAAALLAERGFRVVCLEQRRSLAEAGARWVNGVPEWTFHESGIEPPGGEELRASGHAFHIVSGWGPRRLVLHQHELLEVDMRGLVERLHARARRAGAELRANARVIGFDGRRLRTSAGELEARWFVDASGLSGARLLSQPRVHPRDLCVAAQEVRELLDPEQARAFFESHGVRPGDTLCFTGIAGGFSVVNLRLDPEGLSLLTGSVPAEGHPSGPRLLADFIAGKPWIGPRLFGGSRAIPLRRPFDRLGRGNVLLLGDAACQVFAAHGSGIGAGLLGAGVLADTLASGGDAHAYGVGWHRRFGGLFAGYEVFRRFAQRLTPEAAERLMESGLLDEWGARAGLVQRLPALDRAALPRAARAARALASHRDLSRRLLPTLGRMIAAQLLYARYPRDPSRLADFSRRAARVLGGAPDPS
jgi:menaquinone-9 beta-reductase